jgi:hypothetical protein
MLTLKLITLALVALGSGALIVATWGAGLPGLCPVLSTVAAYAALKIVDDDEDEE